MRHRSAIIMGVYTLTPTHCGTGQAASAVDLPVARESHTGLPVLPATTLKGVARDASDPPATKANVSDHPLTKDEAEKLFGSRPPLTEGTSDGEEDAAERPEKENASGGTGPPSGESDRSIEAQLKPGSVIFTDARLLLLPVRSLQRPFCHVTSPFLLDRLARDLAAFELTDAIDLRKGVGQIPDDQKTSVLVADANLAKQPLVLEDLVYTSEEIGRKPELEKVAREMAKFLPPQERDLVVPGEIDKNLVVVPHDHLKQLVEQSLPVAARTLLTDAKTTEVWGDQRGNLWYEETVPADCLFYNFVTVRAQEAERDHLTRFVDRCGPLIRRPQIGGNETVGQGQCWWTIVDAFNERGSSGSS